HRVQLRVAGPRRGDDRPDAGDARGGFGSDRMMGRLRMRIIVLVAVTLVGSPHPIAAQAGTSGCLAPDDTSARIVAYVKFILTDTSQASARTRDSLGITGVQPSQVVSVTNSQACSKI